MDLTPLPATRRNDLFLAALARSTDPDAVDTRQLHRRATGSIHVPWVCPSCTVELPPVDRAGMTDCCTVPAFLRI